MAGAVLLFIAALLLPVHVLCAQDAAGDASIDKTSQLGPVTARVTLTPAEPLIGDAVSLSIEVSAEQGVEVLMPEFGQAFDRFTIIDFVPDERLDAQGRSVASQKYTLQMPSSGEHQIPPVIIEFIDHRPGRRAAPEGEDSFELLTERITFQVRPVAPAAAGTALKPPLGELQAVVRDRDSSWLWPAGILIGLASMLAAFFAWWFLRSYGRRARQRSAYDLASARLRALRAEKHLDASTMKPFFIELSAIVRRYLEDRFALHAPELTTEEFLDVAAASPDLTAGHRRFLREFLQQADQVKFARHIPDADHASSALDAADQFLQQTRDINETGAAGNPREAAHA